MGDNEGPKPSPQIMQIAMFHPGAGPSSSSNPPPQASSSSQPPQLQPQVLLKPPPARQPPQNPNAPQAMNPQTPAFFQPITPTPVRMMVPNPKPGAPNTAPPTLENLRLVGTAQYRTLIAPPNTDGTQRTGPQFTKIAPRGPVRYAMIQPGQAILTLPRSVQPRTLAGTTGQIQTVFQAVPFTTPQIKDPVVINTITFDRVIRPFTLQGKQGGPDGPPVLQQEAPCRQNEASSSSQPPPSLTESMPTAVTIPPEHVGKAKRTASATESSSADISDSESPDLTPTPPRPKRMRKKMVDDDEDVLYPPKQSEASTSDFQPPEAYDYDQFLTEAMFKMKKNVLHHTINGVEITEFTDDLEQIDKFDEEKFKRISAAVGLSCKTPTKSSATTQKDIKTDLKKEEIVESSEEPSVTESMKRKLFFEKLFSQYSPKIPSSTEKQFEEDATTTPDDSVELTPDSDFVFAQASPQNTETPTVPRESRRPRNLADETINTPPNAENDNAAIREQEDHEVPAAAEEAVTAAPAAAEEAVTAAPAAATTAEPAAATPPPATNTPAIVAQPTTRPAPSAPPSEDELKVIAENCALEAAGCSVKQVPGGLPLKRLSQWTIEECQNWTQQVTNCDDYRSIFEREEIDGSVLVFVPYTELAQLLNLRFGPAKKMEVALKVVKAYDSYFDNM